MARPLSYPLPSCLATVTFQVVSGRYLLAVGQLSHGLSSYQIDVDSGKLTKLKAYPVGKNPNWVEILDLP